MTLHTSPTTVYPVSPVWVPLKKRYPWATTAQIHAVRWINHRGRAGEDFNDRMIAAPAPGGRIAIHWASDRRHSGPPSKGGVIVCRPRAAIIRRRLREAGYQGWLG